MNIICVYVCTLGAEGERDWAAVAAVQCRLDKEGGTKLFTDIITSTKNERIFQESIQLAICLLEGGNTEIQVPGLHFQITEIFYYSFL